MIEALFAAWLAVVGVLMLAPASKAIEPWGTAFIAPIVATALTTFVGLVLIVPAMYSFGVWAGVTSVVALAVVSIAATKRMVTRRWIARSMVGAVGVAVVVAVITWQVPMARYTSDSYHYLMSALALVKFGTLEGVVDAYILKRQLATPLLHTLGVVVERGYVSFWTPLLGVATFGTMTWLAVTGLRLMSVPRKWQWAIITPALVFVLTTNRVLFHFFYINGHMLFAGFLLGGVGLSWLATRTKDWTLFLPASLLFAALIPTRAESAIVIGAFLLVLVTARPIPIRWKWILILPSIVTTLAWDVLVLPRLLSEPTLKLLQSPIAEVVVMVGLIILTALAGTGWFPKTMRAVPWLALGGIAVILGGLVLREPQLIIDTIDGMSTALTVTGLWGTFWLVVPFLVLGAVIVGFAGDRYMLFGLFSFALIIPLLAYLRGSPFHEGPGDSANRMMMHIVPLLVLVVVLAAGRAAQALASRVDEPNTSGGSDSAAGAGEQASIVG